MDYEKKYKEALVKLKEHFTPTSDGIIAGISRELIEDIFPELRESEDEKIRKGLIKALSSIGKRNWGGIDVFESIAWLEKQSTPQVRTGLEWVNTIDDACDKRYAEEYAHGEYCHEQSFKWGFQEGVDWLEKQGEPTDINPSEFDLRLNKLLKQFETLPKEELANCLSFYLNVVQNDGTYREEKQVEQKSSDKVEPKFKVGDWLVKGDTIAQILDIQEQYYVGLDINGKDFTSSRFLNDDKIHLWTIKDAKDGDVLAAEDKDKIFIYNGKLDLRGRVCAYCGIYKTHDGLCFTECAVGNYFTYKEPYPATKEQRDTLIKAMADAGYTFDFDKKELKKIEPFDKYEGLTDFERTLADICIGWIGQELGWKQYIKDNADILLKIAVEKFNSVQDASFEQKPTNEEMKELLHTEYEKGRADAISEMKNHAWSKEDEENLQGIIAEIEANKHSGPVYDIPTYDRFLSWLKSIRPQNRWKPSDEQLRELRCVISGCSFETPILVQLEEDLKKLL